MKVLFFLFLVALLEAISCPHMCSGHGICNEGSCSCFIGWTMGDCSLRSCPYGYSYVDPSGNMTPESRIKLECSAQGKCDRSTGECSCAEGFEGSACDRLSCPNNCNNHGVCVPVTMSKEESNDLNIMEVEADSSRYKYRNWDNLLSFKCVCDLEYRSSDCSEKKCPSGFNSVSQLDYTQTITISTNSYQSNIDSKSCLAYLEYTDYYGNKWYSNSYCVFCEDENSSICKNTKIEGWKEAISKFPTDIINLDNNKPISINENKIIINFGRNNPNYRQSCFRIIMEEDLLLLLSKERSDIHGMTLEGFYLNVNGEYQREDYDNTTFKPLKNVNSIQYTNSEGGEAIECSGHGVCDRDEGLCKCFDGFYGISCSEQADMI